MAELIFPQRQSEHFELVEDLQIGLHGYFVIDKTINTLSCGGLRMLPGISLEEMQDLARIMTLKQAFIGVPRGGARAGIITGENLSEGEKQILINRFGELIRHHLVGRKFLCARDVGTTAKQIQLMYEHVGLGSTAEPASGTRSGYYTALSVFQSIMECLRFKGQNITGRTVAIEGFGKVGSALAGLLVEHGAKVVGLSTIEGGLYNERGLDIDTINSLIENTGWINHYSGAKKIPAAELLELPVDILCPCATHSTINSLNMRNIKAEIICAGANNPVTLAADRYLLSKGVLYPPDFVTNCGGVLGNAVFFLGLTEKHLLKLLQEEVAPLLKLFFEVAGQKSRTPREVAMDYLSARLNQSKASGKQNLLTNRAATLAKYFLRKGLLPKMLLRPLSYKYLSRGIGGKI